MMVQADAKRPITNGHRGVRVDLEVTVAVTVSVSYQFWFLGSKKISVFFDDKVLDGLTIHFSSTQAICVTQ